MEPDELRNSLRQLPFEPFRLVMSDGEGYDIRHPDLLWVGLQTAFVGLTGDKSQTYYERSVKVDLGHIVRLEPLDAKSPPTTNGPAA